MDQTTDNTAWALSRLGNAIDALVDRQLGTQSQQIIGQTGYGIDSNGNLYTLGTTSGGNTAAVAAKPNMMMILLLCAGVYLLAKN